VTPGTTRAWIPKSLVATFASQPTRSAAVATHTTVAAQTIATKTSMTARATGTDEGLQHRIEQPVATCTTSATGSTEPGASCTAFATLTP